MPTRSGEMRTRKVERKPTKIAGQCCTSQGRLSDITVCDLTKGGCRFSDADRGLFTGVPVSIMIAGSGPYRSFVRWREEDDVGVSFVQPLSPEVLEQLLAGKPVTPEPSPEVDAAPVSKPASSFGPLRRIC